MSGLLDKLRARIESEGPITVAHYMAAALADPDFGYYMLGDPFGAAGDFITAPEISQIFGELIGLWCVAAWEQMGGPDPFRLVELGPGRGTLISDALRAAKLRPGFSAAARIHLVEHSAVLRERQRQTLNDYDVTWQRDFSGIGGDGPLLLIANEFFDALPVRQFELAEDGWHERLVACDPGTGALCFVTAAQATSLPGGISPHLPGADIGGLVEFCPTGVDLAREIGRDIAAAGGAALIIDYGHDRTAVGETLQAVRHHRPHDVLADPGTADLTVHVDFEVLSKATGDAGVQVYGPRPQGAFLRDLGIEARAAVLKQHASGSQAEEIEAACHRLIGSEEMGTLFKALALAHPDLPPPVGFHPVLQMCMSR